jgi:hypothetical protein
VDLQTGIRIERVIGEFYKPLPKWAVWMTKRTLKKHAGNPQIGYLISIGRLKWQGFFAGAQAVTFLAFLVAGFVFATASSGLLW